MLIYYCAVDVDTVTVNCFCSAMKLIMSSKIFLKSYVFYMAVPYECFALLKTEFTLSPKFVLARDLNLNVEEELGLQKAALFATIQQERRKCCDCLKK